MSGILPEDKIKECQIVFKKFSKDGENLTERELKNALNALGASPTKEEIEEIMRDIDKDCSGKVELQEFLEIFAKNMKDPDIEDDLMDAFKNFDIFNKNYIAVEEMRRFMTTCGTKMSNTDFDNFIQIYMDNKHKDDLREGIEPDPEYENDDYVDYRIFVKILLRD